MDTVGVAAGVAVTEQFHTEYRGSQSQDHGSARHPPWPLPVPSRVQQCRSAPSPPPPSTPPGVPRWHHAHRCTRLPLPLWWQPVPHCNGLQPPRWPPVPDFRRGRVAGVGGEGGGGAWGSDHMQVYRTVRVRC